MTSGGELGFFRLFVVGFEGTLSAERVALLGCFVGAGGGRSFEGAGGEGSEESGDNEVTSIEGDRCRVVEAGELGVGESSGTGGGGRTKWKTRVAIWICDLR